jgi:hypothetical protein
MTYTAIDNSQSVIQHYGKKGMKWGVRSRHADLRANHESYKKLKKQAKGIVKDINKEHKGDGTSDGGYTKWRLKEKVKGAKKYNKAEELRRVAQERYQKNGGKTDKKISKYLNKYNKLQKEISNHDNNYNMSSREYFSRKGK